MMRNITGREHLIAYGCIQQLPKTLEIAPAASRDIIWAWFAAHINRGLEALLKKPEVP